MSRVLALAALVGAAGCDRLDVGFGVALDVAFASTVTDAEIATVSRLRFLGRGDERTDVVLDLERPMARVERLVYRPDLFTRQLEISVVAEDAARELVAVGSTGELALQAGATTRAEAILRRASDFDGGVGDLVFTGDLSGNDLAGADLGGSIVFDCPHARTTSAVPTRLLAADLDGDGRDDLIAAYQATGQIEVYLGKATGEVPAPLLVGTSGPLVGLATGDVDGDGKIDLVTATMGNTSDASVRVHAGQGDGTFVTRPPVLASNAALGAVVVDQLDGTGAQDIAVVVGNRIVVLFDLAADGVSYAASTEVVLPSQPDQLTTGLINIDGHRDLVGLVFASATLIVAPNDQKAMARTFGPVTSTAGVGGLTSASGFAVRQLDGATGDDLAIEAGNGANITFVFNDTAGGFAGTPTRFTPPQATRGFALRDLDKDGAVDLLTLHAGTAQPASLTVTTSVLAAGLGGTSIAYAMGVSPARLTAGDFNGDGLVDAAVASAEAPGIAIALGRAGGRLGAGELFTPFGRTSGLAGVAVGPLTTTSGGGASLFVAESSANRVTVYAPRGSLMQYLPVRDLLGATTPQGLAVADTNGNGTEDLLVAAASMFAVADDAPAATTLQTGSLGGSNTDILVADLFGDGPVVVMVESRAAGGRVHLFRAGVVGTTTIDVPGTTDLRTALIGDWNGDGRKDIAVIDGSLNASKLVALLQTTTRTFAPQLPTSLPLSRARGLARVRLDADAFDDLAIGGLGGIAAYSGSATGLVASPYAPGAAVEGLASADLDGDGLLDLVVPVSPSLIAFAPGATLQTLGGVGQFCLNGASNGRLAVRDVDGDGRPDVVSSGPGGGAVLLRNRSP